MKNFFLLCTLILCALLISALLNYPLYTAFNSPSLDQPHKLINNIGKLVLIPLIIIFLIRKKLLNKKALGYQQPSRLFIQQLIYGWLAGVAILGILVFFLWLLDIRTFRTLPNDALTILFRMIIGGLIGGLIIGFIEETFFRGIIFSAIKQETNLITTMILGSLIYASMHFITPQALPSEHTYNWTSGLTILSHSFDTFKNISFIDSFIALFVAGILLTLVREHFQSLAFAIGIHAGWVFVIKIFKKFTDINPDAYGYFLIGEYNGIIGWLAALWLSLLVLLFIQQIFKIRTFKS